MSRPGPDHDFNCFQVQDQDFLLKTKATLLSQDQDQYQDFSCSIKCYTTTPTGRGM